MNSPFLDTRLTDAQRAERSAKARKVTLLLTKHEEDKQAFLKGWKLKKENLETLHDQFEEEAASGIDQGKQLAIPGTEFEPPPPAPAIPARWARFCAVEPPRVDAWTFDDLELSPVALELWTLTEGKKSLPLQGVASHLKVSEDAALDAACELAFAGLLTWWTNTTHPERTALDRRAEYGSRLLLVGRASHSNGELPVDLVLEELPKDTREVVTVRRLQMARRIPRRILDPVLAGLVQLGVLEACEGGFFRRQREAVAA